MKLLVVILFLFLASCSHLIICKDPHRIEDVNAVVCNTLGFWD